MSKTDHASNFCILLFGYKLKVSSDHTLKEEIAGESWILVNEEVGGAEDEKTVKV